MVTMVTSQWMSLFGYQHSWSSLLYHQLPSVWMILSIRINKKAEFYHFTKENTLKCNFLQRRWFVTRHFHQLMVFVCRPLHMIAQGFARQKKNQNNHLIQYFNNQCWTIEMHPNKHITSAQNGSIDLALVRAISIPNIASEWLESLSGKK